MQNALTTLRIQNFKSIKDVTMHPRRVNIIIGEPNVGKSNILEAISLLGGMQYDKKRRFMDGMVRYEQVSDLFFDTVIANAITVESNFDVCLVTPDSSIDDASHKPVGFVAAYMTLEEWNDVLAGVAYVDKPRPIEVSRIIESVISGPSEDKAELSVYTQNCIIVPFDRNGRRPNHIIGGYVGDGGFIGQSFVYYQSVVQPYFFVKQHPVDEQTGSRILSPPFGGNLKSIIQSVPTLRREIVDLLKQTGHKLSLRMSEKKLEIIKDLDGVIYSYPYSSIADTLQRLIFYLAAIESNDDAVLLFEEPGAHSYPVYVSQLARRVVESRNNQFFVVTHSPYFMTEVLEEMLTKDELKPELAIFVAYYESYQTKVRQLSDKEVYNIRRDGLDVFYNMARFVPQAGE